MLEKFGLEREIQGMRRDKAALVIELARLRQKQESAKTYLRFMEEKLIITERKQQMMMDFMLNKVKKPSFLENIKKRKQQEIENLEQSEEMTSSHGVEDYVTFVKAEPEEYGDQFGGVFGNVDELHIASMEDQRQDDRVQREMNSEGIWKADVLSDEICILGEHLL